MARESDAESWQLPIIGFEVLEVLFSGELYLTAYGTRDEAHAAPPTTSIRLGGRFTYRDPAGRDHRIVGDHAWADAVPVLGLRHALVTAATADRRGNLELKFSNGSALSAQADPHYECWAVTGPGTLELVSPPGGGDPRVAQ